MSGLRRALRGAAFLAACVLGGCSIGPKMTDQPATYDLGPPRNHAQADPGITAVLVPARDRRAGMAQRQRHLLYRLNYDNPGRPQSYTLSRWTAAPSALLTQRLRSRFTAAGGIVTGADGVRATTCCGWS